MGCVLDRMYIYVSIKKQYLEMRYNNVKTFLKGFVCLFVLGPNVFFVQVVLWSFQVLFHISIDLWICLSLIFDIKHDVYHFFGILRGLFHFSVGMGVSTLLGLELVLINYRNVSFFSVSWLVILTLPLTPAILKSSLLILLSLWLSLNFCPERIYWGKTESPWFTEFCLLSPDS